MKRCAGMLAAVTTLSVLAGCTGPTDTSPPAETSAGINEVQPNPDESSQPEAPPEFYPDLPAATNLPFFEHTLAESGAGVLPVSAEDITQALIGAGFQAADIEMTPEKSLIALPADSVSVAVAFAGECLVGQYTDEWLAVDVVAPLPDGRCLVLERETLD
ncbi:lipoprotein [Pontimonas salivibrio]|uniref:Lipoprotein n=1 Tax=Pontimonas salivibrio TaxID=1159327 RepID=A0A2L2BPW3_9MICO|nr:hypothetical protein [Pontimonas salivibrio]AVG23711.1 lipoprotein [Pontimonas salivibrio]